MASQRSKRIGLGLLLAGVLGAPAGWLGTDYLERDNDFCNACHLEPGVALHVDIRRDFDARPAASLAGVHAQAMHPERGEGSPFRCIDCHGGVGWVGKARTKALAAKDGFWWVVGDFEEPTGMEWPLWDADCRQCHPDFREAEQSPEAASGNPPFHALGVHNVELGVSCVECHLSHETGGEEDLYHLRPAHVREKCALCHAEFE